MQIVTRLAPYEDERGNRIEFDGVVDKDIEVRFRGSNNRLVVARHARVRGLKVFFDRDNAVVRIGRSRGVPSLSLTVRAGQDSRVLVGRNVSSTGRAFLSATEGTRVVIGHDVMLATGNEVRADDAHAIFDVRTGKRVNRSRSVRIGDHVWLAREAVVLGGVIIGSGSVIGYRSLVTRSIPNNCVAVGTPARVVRRDIAWGRTHLDKRPPYVPDATADDDSPYWDLTRDAEVPRKRRLRRIRRTLRRARRVLRRVTGSPDGRIRFLSP